jgi:hypothetical protein
VRYSAKRPKNHSILGLGLGGDAAPYHFVLGSWVAKW